MEALIWNRWASGEEDVNYFEDANLAQAHFKWSKFKHLETLLEMKLYIQKSPDSNSFRLEDKWSK